MKKRFLAFVALGLMVASCGPSSKSDYDEAAETLCSCMEDASKVDPPGMDMTSSNLGVCIVELDAEVVKNEMMKESIKEKCPDIKDAFDAYVKDM
ncbi:MAG: hypothetical protein ACI865_001493 [Flavobacteriaceae bacterium]|jgi:hypothetical protein